MNRFLKPPDRVLNSFSNSEKMIYEYLLKNIDTIGTSNISKISNDVYTSPASVFNLLKKMGYSGFKEFKFESQLFAKELERLAPLDNQLQADFEKIIDSDSIISTCKNQRYSQIEKVCRDIRGANRVLVIANEITRFVAKDFTYRMQLCDVDVIASFDQKQYKVLLSKNVYDYVIVFSKFGNTEKIINAVEASNRKVNLLITTNPSCFLEQYCDTVLYGKQTTEDNLKEDLGDISSRITLFILADIIINTYIYSYISKREEDEKI